MSLLLMLFYWVVIPYTVFWLARRSWRNSESTLSKGLVIGVASIVFAGLWWWGAGEKWMLDRQVRELCAKDGGVKVYETVKLPAEKFNGYGQVNFYRPIDGENALGPEYVFKESSYYFKRGNPTLIRHHYLVLRNSDGKLLGETVSYGRGGGIPGPWHPSSFTCPEIKLAGPNALLKAVFILVK